MRCAARSQKISTCWARQVFLLNPGGDAYCAQQIFVDMRGLRERPDERVNVRKDVQNSC